MESQLLATKLQIPLQPRQPVQRDRLLEALERQIPSYPLTTISAPAGYGKTTLLAQWARESRTPVAWLSLSESDNDAGRFLRYLFRAWESVQLAIRETPLDVLLGSMHPDREAVLSAFVNIANDVPDRTVIVLDDYHLIEEPQVHESITFLIDHLPPTLHLVLAGRGEPWLPVARFRARGHLLEIGTDDLRFTLDEADEFLRHYAGLSISHDEIRRLQAKLEGWAAGFHLAALTLRHHRATTDGGVVSGQLRYIADYLSEDVLAGQPEHVQQFLLQTSVLDRLSGPLCDAVTGGTDGQEMLRLLEGEDLFLVPLDDSRTWFRYHRAFADFLREELNRSRPDDLDDYHRLAGWWYFSHDLPEPAFDHGVAGSDPELVVRVFERYLSVKLNGGELHVVARWLDSIPREWYAAYPLLILCQGAKFAYSGAFEACVRSIDDAERRLTQAEGDDTRWQMALITAVRCFIACIQNDLTQAEVYAGQALQDLRDESIGFRADIYQALGDTYRRNGRWEEAKNCYLQVQSVAQSPDFPIQQVVQLAHVFGALADLELRQGRLRDAAGYWRKALEVVQEPGSWGRLDLPATGWVFIRMGEILYEWNELAAARDHVARGIERAELGGDVRTMVAGYLLAGRLKLTEGDVEGAVAHLEQARLLVEEAPFPEWLSRFERFQLECWLAQDRLRAAVNWADDTLQAEALDGHPESEAAQQAIARVLIVKGDPPSLEEALALLEYLVRTAEAEGRTGVQIEALALQSLTYWRRGDRGGAMTVLERALRLAEPEGFVRLFADLGLPMARLLQEAQSRDVMLDYVATLLAACSDLVSADALDTTLPEPLTDREQEILEMIAAGLTNPEIAEKLFISSQTVGKHAGNIYGKLGVHSRTEAAARARALDLLG